MDHGIRCIARRTIVHMDGRMLEADRSEGPNPAMAAHLEEQQEKLRRVVDGWRSRSEGLLDNLLGDPFESPSSVSDSYSSSSDPIRVHVEPLEHSDCSALLESDNAAASKFVTVLAHDCVEISRFRQHASRNLYRQLLLFGHSSSTNESLLEGEPHKAFGRSFSLFMELSDTVGRMTAVLGNLLQQLNSITSSHDKNVRPLNSFKNLNMRTVFESLGEGLAMFLILDEILAQNSRIKGHLSLFARMLNKAKLELDTFGISVADLELLDQVVSHLEKLIDIGLFKQLLQGESSLFAAFQQTRSNKKFVDACTHCIVGCLSEILPVLDTWKEFPRDRKRILHHMALFLLCQYTFAEVPEKRLWKLILEMLQVIPVIYVEGSKRIDLLHVLERQFPQSLSSWPPLKEAHRDFDVMMGNYLMRLNEIYLRDSKAIRGALSFWVASFQLTLHPLSEIPSEACLRLHLKQMIQGILLANRLRTFTLSILDLHALLEVPIRKEVLVSLGHMVVSLKVLGNTFRSKVLEIIKSLPHILNVIQGDIEQIILPSKAKLHAEVMKGSQGGKFRLLSSLTRGARDTDTKLNDSLSLLLISLQMLQGGGSSKRQLIFSITLDAVQSIGHQDIDFPRIRKFVSKLATMADFQTIIEEATDCSFLYWRKEMIANWSSIVYKDAGKFSWLQYLLDAFSDGLWLLKLCHVGRLTQKAYEEEIENVLRRETIAPLCRDVETDLRLHVHSTQLKGSVSVNLTKSGVRNLYWYLQMKALRLPFKFIDIRLHVESYLNSAFYNHMSLSSCDWKIYADMQQLAELKYRLVLDDIHHAEHYPDWGLDVHGIVENMEAFAENYSYNIEEQDVLGDFWKLIRLLSMNAKFISCILILLFTNCNRRDQVRLGWLKIINVDNQSSEIRMDQVLIEKIPNDQVRKNFRVIGVDHVASSIATLGLQAVSIASNSIFKFLIQMLMTLNELFQDRFLRSHLGEESHLWKSHRGTLSPYNPGHRGGLHIAKGKLPLGQLKVSLVEQLQSVMIKIGNALGLLRIVLAGSCRLSCNMSRFICQSGTNMNFTKSCEMLGFSDGIATAGRVMDVAFAYKSQIDNLSESFSSVILLLSKDLRSRNYDHLANFFLIVPSLLMNIVDSKVEYKEKTLRKDRDSGKAVNSDGSFTVGVAFLLKVMEQDKSFDELNWFDSARRNLEEAAASLEDNESPGQTKGSTLAGLKLWSQAPSISTETQKGIDKLKRCQKELELIRFHLNIARTLML